MVQRAFAKLDRNSSGQVDFNDVCELYDAKRHPAVIEGRKTERQALEEFLMTFELHTNKQEGSVSLQEFIDYFTNVSASIEDDAYFTQLMNQTWNLD